MNRGSTIYHIATRADADALARTGILEPSSLAGEGFVHCSTVDQVVATTERHFDDGADLVLIELDPERIVHEITWPEVYPGVRFPHVHGPLGAKAVIAVHPWGPSERNSWPGV